MEPVLQRLRALLFWCLGLRVLIVCVSTGNWAVGMASPGDEDGAGLGTPSSAASASAELAEDSVEEQTLVGAFMEGIIMEQTRPGEPLLPWLSDSAAEANVKTIKANTGLLEAVVQVIPDRVPRVSELAAGFLKLDDRYSRNLSGAKTKKTTEGMGDLEL